MNRKKQILTYLSTDYISANIAWFIYDVFRYYIIGIALGYHTLTGFLSQTTLIVGQIVFPLFWICIYYHSGYYNKPFKTSLLSELFTTLISVIIGTLTIFFIFILDDLPPSYIIYYKMIGTLLFIQFTCTYIPRLILTNKTIKKIHRREWGFNTLIIGVGNKASQLTGELDRMHKSPGYFIVGYCQTYSTTSQIDQAKILGSIEEIDLLIEKHQIQHMIIAEEAPNYELYHAILSKLFKYNIPIQIVADNYDILTGNVKMSTIYSFPLINVMQIGMNEWEKTIKKSCDYLISALALILLSPIYLFIAWRIKAESEGPVFYKQKRIGLYGKEFDIYKFRSMIIDAEKGMPQLTASQNDPRITPFGKILRKYRLDELPQFWNVLRGEMSIVGPRPERAYYIQQIIEKAPFYYTLQCVKPGITSWGMVKYGYANTIQKMIERSYYDILYIENMSLIVDLKIIFYTIRTVITGKGI